MPNVRMPFETLESRRLMSVGLFDAAVVADRAHIRADFVKLDVNLYADANVLKTDSRALRADHLDANTTLAPLVAALRSDVAGFKLTLLADRLAEASNVVADELVIVKELQQMRADKASPTALAADKTQLTADRVQLQTSMVAGLTQRLDGRERENIALQADSMAIMTALPTSGATAQLTADVEQWLGDKGANLNRITADVEKISADRSQLIVDLSAMT